MVRGWFVAALAIAVLVSGMPALGEGSEPSFVKVADGFTEPLYITNAGDGSGRLFIVEKAGAVKIIRDGQTLAQPFLDWRHAVSSDDLETGMTGLAFHPDYANNGRVFLVYNEAADSMIITEFTVDAADPNVLDPLSFRLIMRIDEVSEIHNVNQLAFGPDGYLYIGSGEGGRLIPAPVTSEAQRTDSPLGGILRIDVDNGDPYSIPADNPYNDEVGAAQENWAKGLRNPSRFSFDSATGDLWIGDVGEGRTEEVNFIAANSGGGQNFGWPFFEGTAIANTVVSMPVRPDELTWPVLTYPHAEGCAVTGGFVYHGEAIPDLQGQYIYGDFCNDVIWTLDEPTHRGGRLQSTRAPGPAIDTNQIASFGLDEAGELYAVRLGYFEPAGGAVYKLSP